ncbi:MAG: alkaline phosphatase PhoX [Gemmatimonadota bacterium]
MAVSDGGSNVLDNPDNITVSPRGGLVLCEDGSGVQFMRGLTRTGEIFDLESVGESSSSRLMI